jgi:di/tricarboxylate transporter
VHTIERKSLRKQDAQNGSTISGFGRHFTDFLTLMNHEMHCLRRRLGPALLLFSDCRNFSLVYGIVLCTIVLQYRIYSFERRGAL